MVAERLAEETGAPIIPQRLHVCVHARGEHTRMHDEVETISCWRKKHVR